MFSSKDMFQVRYVQLSSSSLVTKMPESHSYQNILCHIFKPLFLLQRKPKKKKRKNPSMPVNGLGVNCVCVLNFRVQVKVINYTKVVR